METINAAQQSSKRVFPSWLSIFLVFSNLCLFSCVAWVYARYGSVGAAIDYFNGRYVHVRSAQSSLFNVAPGQEARASYVIENRGSKPIRILGCGMGCAGRPAGNLPLLLEPGKAYTFAIDVRPSAPRGNSGNSVRMPVTLYTDDANQPEVTLSIDWTVNVSKKGEQASN